MTTRNEDTYGDRLIAATVAAGQPADRSPAALAVAAAHRAEAAATELAQGVGDGPVAGEPAVAEAVAAFQACSAELMEAVGEVEEVERRHVEAVAAADGEVERAAEEGRKARPVPVPDVGRTRAEAAARVRGTLTRLRTLREAVTEAQRAALPARQAREVDALPGLADDARDAVRTARAALTRALDARQAAMFRAMEPHIPAGGDLGDVDGVKLPDARVRRALAGLEEASALFEDAAVFSALRGDDLVVLPVIKPSRKVRARMAASFDWTLRDIEAEEKYAVTAYTRQWGKRPYKYDGSIGGEDVAFFNGNNRDAFTGGHGRGSRGDELPDVGRDH